MMLTTTTTTTTTAPATKGRNIENLFVLYSKEKQPINMRIWVPLKMSHHNAF
jgi:hypothetical protein